VSTPIADAVVAYYLLDDKRFLAPPESILFRKMASFLRKVALSGVGSPAIIDINLDHATQLCLARKRCRRFVLRCQAGVYLAD
jgi:hypothetical protein